MLRGGCLWQRVLYGDFDCCRETDSVRWCLVCAMEVGVKVKMIKKTVFQAKCGNCGHVAGEVATADAPITATCPECGKEKMKTVKTVVSEQTALDYEVYIVCKQTNANSRNGFTMTVENLENKSATELKNLFVDKCASCLISMLTVDNVGKLLKEE